MEAQPDGHGVLSALVRLLAGTDVMFEATNSKHAPWHIIRSDDKRRARLNCIAHLLHSIPFKPQPHDPVRLPKRSSKRRADDQASLRGMTFVAARY